jgi:hypothetical protein
MNANAELNGQRRQEIAMGPIINQVGFRMNNATEPLFASLLKFLETGIELE